MAMTFGRALTDSFHVSPQRESISEVKAVWIIPVSNRPFAEQKYKITDMK
jgi:hypothetical protein